jgi:hypothetical protein
MWLLTKAAKKQCESVRDEVERGANGEQENKFVALSTLLARLPEDARKHLTDCSDCRTFAEELLAVRKMFQEKAPDSQPVRRQIAQPGPYFMTRVMAAIADREAEQEHSAETWAAVPHLAHRLSVVASLTLLLAGSWLYQHPKRPIAVAGISAEQASEGLVEGSGNNVQDDFLLVSGGR